MATEGGLGGRRKADHTALLTQKSPGCVTRPVERAGRQENGCIFPEVGGQWVRASRFREALEKFTDTDLAAFMSWIPEEDSSSFFGGPENNVTTLGLPPRGRAVAPTPALAVRAWAKISQMSWQAARFRPLAGFCCHLAAAVRSTPALCAAALAVQACCKHILIPKSEFFRQSRD